MPRQGALTKGPTSIDQEAGPALFLGQREEHVREREQRRGRDVALEVDA